MYHIFFVGDIILVDSGVLSFSGGKVQVKEMRLGK